MKHAREDYDRIQDPAALIPEDEPVFLLRAQDKHAPDVVRDWARRVYARGHGNGEMSRAAMEHADRMETWQREHGCKAPDLPNQPKNPTEMSLQGRNP